MNQVAIPIHKLAEAALSPASIQSPSDSTIQVLADPELAHWHTPYPEAANDLLSQLGSQLASLCPNGALTFMLQKVPDTSDFVRLEVQMDTASENALEDISASVLLTDDLSVDINLLGIDCPSLSQYVVAYDIMIPLVRFRREHAMLDHYANDTTKELENHVVLVVEDNEVNRMVVSKFLTRWGLKVEYAVNGKEAVQKFSGKDYDLVLMDLEMPIMDGYQATEAIRSHEQAKALKPTPIIALTAYAMVEARDKAMGVGMNDFLTKPLDPHQLHAKLSEHVSTLKLQATA